MPPRIHVAQCLRAQNACMQNTSRAFSSSSPSQATTVAHKRKHRDPYAQLQANAKKAANLSRQKVIRVERASNLGDPVRGITTPFIESFDTAQPASKASESSKVNKDIDSTSSGNLSAHAETDTDNHLNFFLTKDELAKGIERSKWLTTPLVEEEMPARPSTFDSLHGQSEDPDFRVTDEQRESIKGLVNGIQPSSDDGTYDTTFGDNMTTPEQRQKLAEAEHETAQEALQRIASLSLSSGKDRLRINTQRCIDVFGRHNTDSTLPPKPKASVNPGTGQLEKTPRVGPDTGSSEVQVAILTAKIRSLADLLETRGRTDKHGKRDLRLLVHRRAKLLKYLRRKERGGPRWQHLIETLGLTEGTWQGEITM
ncbi:unnamed protein product [Zymoseptoria tritici ST99CH_1A5]|uniref:Ribosomal protein S15 n=2 Tax=Zymoseptoria tritici TaxID=1047171 RepID=A0A2H1FKN2_ZYMTR|nr:unnamed protein product [Zymoseptoria tritici ST99CH_1E4]SMR43974.1 unnamed protein product [Zymoseptoria tritici ST99CH_3D1]SMY19131.1 unnamed protein product [Zymoseptoria tritici ST99CH_1A5]